MSLPRKFACFAILICACFTALNAQTSVETATLTFTTIDVPGAAYTGVFGINKNGDLVGNYGQDANADSHGFLYSQGIFTYFDYPGLTVTVPSGINDSGLIVGYAGEEPVYGFLYDGVNFTTLQDGANTATVAKGVNNTGLLVGGSGSIYTTTGFQSRGSAYKKLPVPGHYVYIYAEKANNLGTIVGWTDNDGFICKSGKCQVLDFPGASKTECRGVNDAGLIVGWYNPSSSTDHAFVSTGGKFLSFTYPGAKGTYAADINASGQIVGEYTFDYVVYHGFVTSPITEADFQ